MLDDFEYSIICSKYLGKMLRYTLMEHYIVGCNIILKSISIPYSDIPLLTFQMFEGDDIHNWPIKHIEIVEND